MKKTLSVLLTVCLLLSAFMCVPFGAYAATAGETGTAPSGNAYKVPATASIYDNVFYLITSVEEFCYIEMEPTAKYALVADIELPSTYVPVAEFGGWLRGYQASSIKNNVALPELHSVKLNADGKGAGMFGKITSTGKAFQYIKTTGTVSKSVNTDSVGAFAGWLTGSSYVYFNNCENEATVTGGGEGTGASGGFVGTSTGYPVFENCINNAEIKNGYNNGGYTGKSEGGSMKFTNCVNKGVVSGGTYKIAGFAGALKNGIFTNCANYADVTGYRHVAGITSGFHANNGGGLTIKNTFNLGNIKSTAGSGSTAVAGIVSWTESGVVAEDCYNLGKMSLAYGTAKASIFGLSGTVTGNKENTITRCYDASGEGLPIANNATVTNCYYLADETNTETGALSAKDMKDSTKFVGFDFESETPVWVMNPEGSDYEYPQLRENIYVVTAPKTESGNLYTVPEVVNVYGNNYYLITNKDEFCYMEIEPSARYIIAADIDLTEGYNTIKSFSGVIRSYDPKLLGAWKQHTITVKSTTGGGLFHEFSGTEISYVKLAGDVSGTYTPAGSKDLFTGGFASFSTAAAKISNCENAANIIGSNSPNIGGFFGQALGSPTFENCVNSGTVKNGNYTGGFVGKSEGGTNTFTNCKNTGTVAGGGLCTGGIGGDIKTSVITSCSNEGSVTGYRATGGLIGGYWSTGGGHTIKNSYNTGAITSNATSGVFGAAGILGLAMNKVTITDCFNAGILTSAGGVEHGMIATMTYGSTTLTTSNSTVTNAYTTSADTFAPEGVAVSNSYYLASETNAETGALSMKDMKDSTKYAGFDFTSENAVWEMNAEGSDYLYPQIKGNTYYVTIVYGTPENPYPISSGEEFVELITAYGAENKYFILEEDITLGDAEAGISYEALPFCGNFNGNGKTITIYINNELDSQGLFGVASGEITISNLTLDGSITTNKKIGGFIATTGKKFTITNCVNNAKLRTSVGYAGGFIGYTSGSGSVITNSVNNGDINGADKAAGFIADSQGGSTTLTNCVNNGVIGFGESYIPVYSGGLVGYVKYALITDCANYADVQAYRYAGGIWAARCSQQTGNVTITNTFNIGDVTSKVSDSASSIHSAAGGIIGNVLPEAYMYNDREIDGGITLVSCYNAGTITINSGNERAAGLVGARTKESTTEENNKVLIRIDDCYNIGDVYGKDGIITNTPIIFATEDLTKIEVTIAYYLSTDGEEVDNIDDTVALTMDSFASEIVDYSTNYETSDNDYAFPQLKGNKNAVDVDMYLVTVNTDENGKVSSGGNTFYAKGGNVLKLSAEGNTPGYSVIVFDVNGEKFNEYYLEVEVTEDTVISVSFAEPEFEVIDAGVFGKTLSLAALSENGVDTSALAGKLGALCYAKFNGVYNSNLVDYGIVLSSDETFGEGDTFITKKDTEKASAAAYFYGNKELKGNTYYVSGYIRFTNDEGVEEVIYGTPASFGLGVVINDI